MKDVNTGHPGRPRQGRRACWWLLVWCAPAVFALMTWGAEQTELIQRRRAQQTARELAARLTTGMLDTQLRMLRENGLTELPVYADIQRLQRNIDRLVTNDMQQVIGLLEAESTAEPGLVEARQKVRQIIVALLAERHTVRRRLQVSRTNALVRQILASQTGILETTRTLQAMPRAQRDVMTIETLQDQRDTASVYSQLVSALEDTATWGGKLAAEAAESMRILSAAEVELHLQQAVAALARAQFRSAAARQQSACDGLRALLRRMEAAQGLSDSARNNALRLLQQLIRDQQQLRGETQSQDLQRAGTRDGLWDRQRNVNRQLSELAELLPQTGSVAYSATQAQAAGGDAEQSLFEADQPAALRHQRLVLDALTELQHQLRLVAGAREDRADERRNALERLDQDLDQLLNLQSEVTELAGPDPQGAAAKEQQVAESLADAGQPAPLPEGIQEEFSQAQQAVAAAQAAFQETAAAEASTRQQAAQEAAEALGELAAEVKASLDETPSSQQSDQEAEAGNSSETSASGEPPTAQSGQARQQQEDGAQSTQGTGQTASSQPADGRSASSLTDIAAPPRNIAGEAWFLKLPAEVREAMRASTRLRPPPGYEERLRRYFKSLD